MEVRAADGADLPFLWSMLACAVHWREHSPPADVPGGVTRYLDGWGREGDSALVAIERDTRIGAAWYRLFSGDQPGYGFVSDEIPELTLAVSAPFRRRGVGRDLLTALVERAREAGFRSLSLSVESDNPVLALYEQAGFEPVAESDALTMLLRLS
jgi:ribosomal protein S18 acetylase RimI-like enzyme